MSEQSKRTPLDYYKGIKLRPSPKGGFDLTRDEVLCDLCCWPIADGAKCWTYPCEDFTIALGDLIDNSLGDWAVCDACHELVQAGDDEALIDRLIHVQYDLHNVKVSANEREALRQPLRKHLINWRAHWSAEPYREVTDEHDKEDEK